MKDSKVYADLIIAACKKVSDFIAGFTKEDFMHIQLECQKSDF